MIQEIDGQWFIVYSGTATPFEGPFLSFEAAVKKFDSLRPVDRMIVEGRPPNSRTDREFLMGSENGRQFQATPKLGDAYRESCEKAGGSTTGKKYLRQLASFPGDPKAWVSGRGDVERVAKEKGMGVEGLVNVPTPQVEPPKPVDIAPDILDRETKKMLAGTRGMPKKKQLEVREAIRDKIAQKQR